MTVAITEAPMKVIVDDNGVTVVSVGTQGPAGGGEGTSDHGALSGLADDDHTQYLNNTRGDARYYTKTLSDAAYQPKADVLTNTTASFTTAQETKLAGIASGATANSSDATLLNRANHTGAQAISTVTGLQTALDAKVPYTGATADVDLGDNILSAKSVQIEGTAGNGHIHLKHQSSDANATGASTALYANSSGDLKYKNDGAHYTTFSTSGNTGNRVYTFPDASGTLALTGDIPSAYTDEMAQDAVGAMVDSSLVYADATPLLSRAALTGEVTASAGSNTVTLANSAVIGKVLTGFSAAAGTVAATDSILGAFNKVVGNVATRAAKSQNFSIPVYLSAGANMTLPLDSKAYFGYTIDAIRGLDTSAGSITVAIQINGTPVTGLSALSATTTAQDATATAANTVAAGDRLTAVFSSNSSATGIEFTLACTRSLA